METRKQCNDIFKVLKENNCQTKILYTVKIYFKSESEMNTFQLKNYGEKFVYQQTYTIISTDENFSGRKKKIPMKT